MSVQWVERSPSVFPRWPIFHCGQSSWLWCCWFFEKQLCLQSGCCMISLCVFLFHDTWDKPDKLACNEQLWVSLHTSQQTISHSHRNTCTHNRHTRANGGRICVISMSRWSNANANIKKKKKQNFCICWRGKTQKCPWTENGISTAYTNRHKHLYCSDLLNNSWQCSDVKLLNCICLY